MKKLLPCLLLGGGVAAHAAPPPNCIETYQYEDEHGHVVLAQSIPPELAYKGYKVLCQDGRVVREQPRQLTPQEIAERERKAEQEKAKQEAEKQRAHEDQELARMYASPAEIEAARDRKLRSLDQAISILKANRETLEQQKAKYEQQAAELERNGQLASPEILQNLQILDQKIKDSEAQVASREKEKAQVRDQYQKDIDRYVELFPERSVKPATGTVPQTALTSGSSNPA